MVKGVVLFTEIPSKFGMLLVLGKFKQENKKSCKKNGGVIRILTGPS